MTNISIGPVVAASCHIPFGVTFPGIEEVDDSKKLSLAQREKLFDVITKHPDISYSITVESNKEIDRINILQASLQAMATSATNILSKQKFENGKSVVVLVDGNKSPTFNEEIKSKYSKLVICPVVKGDTKVLSIAAASILAKVHRDGIMDQLDKQYPQYGFAQHKGYPTKAHYEAIKKHGITPVHRLSYRLT